MYTGFRLVNREDASTDGSYYNGSEGKRTGACGLDSSGSGQGLVPGSCQHDDEPLGSIK